MPSKLQIEFQIPRNKTGPFLYDSHILPIYEWKKHQVSPDKKIMTRLLNVIIGTFSRSQKILVLRFDLHVQEYSECNEVISLFNKKIAKELKHLYHWCWFQLFWVREHGRGPHQHYHYVLITDGQRINHPVKLNDVLKECWHTVSQGHFSLPKNCYYLWHRGDRLLFGKIVYRLSYLAKNVTKKRFNQKTKRYGIRCLVGRKPKPTKSLAQLLNARQPHYQDSDDDIWIIS